MYSTVDSGLTYTSKMILTAPRPDNWKRPPGRPRITWLNSVQRDLRAYTGPLQFRYDCRRTIRTSIFEFSRDVAMATNFRFLKFRFFRRNSETTRDGRVVPGKENVGNFLFSRVAPFVMTSDDPESRNCFRFVLLLLLLRVRSTQKVRDRFSSFFFSSW